VSADPLQQELRAALDRGAAQARELHLSVPAQAFTRLSLAILRKREPAAALNSIEGLRKDLQAVDAVLSQIYDQARAAEDAEAKERPLGQVWMNDLGRRLAGAEEPAAWVGAWLDAWSQALTASRWDRCRDVIRLEHLTADLVPVRKRLTTIVDRLEREDGLETLLTAITEVLDTDNVPAMTRTTLLILTSRILPRLAADPDEAIAAADQAFTLGRTLDRQRETLARAAYAEALLVADRLSDVHPLVDTALEVETAVPDLLIVAGRLATRESRFDLTNELYDAVALRFGLDATTGHLLRETPANLLWRTARLIAPTQPAEALALLDRALAGGIAGKGDHPQRRAIQERAQLLEAVDRDTEAASAYATAAWQFSQVGWPKRAVKLYAKAVELDPNEARYRFEYAEALRSRHDPLDGDVNTEALTLAREHLERGLELQAPTPELAWVLVSGALLGQTLGTGPDPALLIERSVLIDPEYARGYAFLASMLRDAGYPTEAAEAARRGYLISPGDDVVTQHHVILLCDFGRYAEAIDVVEEYRLRWADSEDLLLWQAMITLRTGDVEGTLDIMDQGSAEGIWARMLRAYCYGLLGRTEEERAVLAGIWEGRNEPGGRTPASWAAFRLGLLDESVELLNELRAAARPDDTLDSDLAQVLLARGNATHGDLTAGTELLHSGIDKITALDQLVHLVTADFPLLTTTVAGTPHEQQVLDILVAALPRIETRAVTLRSQRRSADVLAVRLAQAREALANDNAESALAGYLDLAIAGQPPEAGLGLARAAAIILERGDQELAAGRVLAAQDTWRQLLPAAAAQPDSGVREQVGARLGFSALELNGPDDPQAVSELRDRGAQPLADALTIFARDVPTLWAHHDGLRAIAAQQGLNPDQAGKLSTIAAELPLAAVYATERAAVPEQALSPFVTGLELTFGSGHAALVRSEELNVGIPLLRDRLSREWGVRIPGVRVRVEPRLPPDAVHTLVYGLLVDAGTVPAGAGAGDGTGAVVLAGFEQILTDNLFRWISLDDINLWAAGWDVLEPTQTTQTSEALIPADPAARLRLTRVLRMLLREGVPIVDRPSILRGFLAADQEEPEAAHTALAQVRRLLYPATLGPNAGRVRMVPDPLQARLNEGLSADGRPIWTLPRPATTALVAELRAWRRQLSDGSVAIGVLDARLRPFLWRLLAADRPRIYVMAHEELVHEELVREELP
jgi:tetratricopeptide (TPR) repeat protein